jgi:hypothetical protein
MLFTTSIFICAVNLNYAKQQFNYVEEYLHKSYKEAEKAFHYSRYLATIIDRKFYQELCLVIKTLPPLGQRENFVNEFHWWYQLKQIDIFVPVTNASPLKDTSPLPIVISWEAAVIVVLPTMTRIGSRYMLRMLRDTIIRRYEDYGYGLFHAAVAVIKEKGILIVGSKGAGKTSLLCHFLHATSADFLANDRVLIGGIKCENLLFVPLPIRISNKTIDSIPSLAQFMAVSPSLNRTLSEETPPTSLVDNKLELTPRELGIAFDAGLSTTAKLSVILFPQFKPSLGQGVEFHLINLSDAVPILRECCFTPNDESWRDTWVTSRVKSQAVLESECQAKLERYLA